jgi:hypothetical protein
VIIGFEIFRRRCRVQKTFEGDRLQRRTYEHAFGLAAESDRVSGALESTGNDAVLLGTDSHPPDHAHLVMQGADVREDSGVWESDAETCHAKGQLWQPAPSLTLELGVRFRSNGAASGGFRLADQPGTTSFVDTSAFIKRVYHY